MTSRSNTFSIRNVTELASGWSIAPGKLLASVALSALSISAMADESIIVQSTTSTANSGLYDALLPLFKESTGITVNVVAVGTGQAINNARNCDGDVLLVHARASEEAFVESGFGVSRSDLMYNDFIIVGPSTDPANIRDSEAASTALQAIAQSQAMFASRGDDSGTHKKELSLWADADIDPFTDSGAWYRDTGSGMGATLNTGVGMGAYVLSDRATWISFENKADFEILFQGDEDLFNQYGVIAVNPEKCPSVKQQASKTFIDWLLSSDGQSAIDAYLLDGQQLFFANGPKTGGSAQ